ncbi:MAG: DUF5666 domain-containing protein [Fimbriimonadaceae bacterium]|nr:DUF5666 domain-containing protein [Fimbriimonadaceae bacterium]
MRNRQDFAAHWLGALLVIGLLAIGLVGCGGSGGSAGGSGTTRLFLTDDLSTAYDAVWVNVFSAELEGDAGSVKLMESTAGEAVNLRALGSPSGGRFLFLGLASVPQGTYRFLDVRVGKDLTLFATGSTTGTSAQFIPSLDSGAGRSRLRLALDPPLVIGPGNQDIIADFALSSWTLSGGLVTPVVTRHNGQGLDDLNRHEADDIEGIISNLSGSAPNQMFRVNGVDVMTDSMTVLQDLTALSNGTRVEVYGVFDVLLGAFKAVKIEKDDGPGTGGEAKVKGPASSADEAAGTLKIRPDLVRAMIPSASPVKVVATTSTVYEDDNGAIITKAQFFSGLAAAGASAEAEAEGTYDSASNTLTARKLELENEDEGLEQEAKGSLVSSDVAVGTVVIQVSESFGFTLPADGKVTLKTKESTTYKNASGDSVTKAQFFALLTAGAKVKGNGAYASGTLTCRKMEIKD